MELSKAQLTTIVTLAVLIASAVAGTMTYSKDTTYYCNSKDLVFECSEGLSDSKLTCYYKDSSGVKRGKRCDAPWTPIGDSLVEINKPSEPEVILVDSDTLVVETNPRVDCVVHFSGCYDRGFIDRKIDCGVCN